MRIESMNLSDMLRARLVDRWQIVRTHKKQSTAEHSFDVILIAYHFHEQLVKTIRDKVQADHVFGLKLQIMEFAMIHDLPEVITGDLPSPLKAIIDCAPIKELEGGLLGNFQIPRMGEDDMGIVWGIVKAADFMADIMFLREDGFGQHAMFVLDRLMCNSEKFIKQCQLRYGGYSDDPVMGWKVAWNQTYELCRKSPLYIEHIIDFNQDG